MLLVAVVGVVVVDSNTDTTDRMSGILGVAEERKSDGGWKGAAAALPRGRSGEAGVRCGVRTGLTRPPSLTLGSRPDLTYLSWAVG